MKINKCLSLIVYGILMGLSFPGCQQYNVVYTPLVPDCGAQITTQHKYRIDDCTVILENGKRISQTEFDPNFLNMITTSQANVFSFEGIPVNVIIDHTQREVLESWGKFTIFIPCLISAFTLPAYFGDEHCRLYQISVNGGRLTESVKIHEKRTIALTLYSPIAWLVPMSDEYEARSGYRTFHEHGRGSYYHIKPQALAYGIAVRLKEMEDSGLINSTQGKTKMRSSVPLPVNSMPPVQMLSTKPNLPISPKPVIKKSVNTDVPARQGSSNQSFEVENLTVQ